MTSSNPPPDFWLAIALVDIYELLGSFIFNLKEDFFNEALFKVLSIVETKVEIWPKLS